MEKNEVLINILDDIIKEFMIYLQQKSDFNAEVCSEFFRPLMPAYLYRDIILPFDRQIILKEYIGRNEGIENHEKIKINVIIKNKNINVNSWLCEEKHTDNNFILNKRCIKRIYGNKNGICGNKIYPDKIDNIENDIVIEVPGTLGKFALYNILEGFIRNSCKHNIEKLKSIIDQNEAINIFINVEENNEEKDYYICEIYDDISEVDDNKIRELNSIIKKPMIDKRTGKLIKENWGLQEFKICAALLKGVDMIELEQMPESCITAIKKEVKENAPKYYLGYKFNLKKYLKGISLGEKWKNNENILQKGYYYFPDIRDALGHFKGTIPHELIIMTPEQYNGNDKVLSHRVIILDKNNNYKQAFSKNIIKISPPDIQNNSIENEYITYRLIWLIKFFNLDGIKIFIRLCGLDEDLYSKWSLYNDIYKNFICVGNDYSNENDNLENILIDHHKIWVQKDNNISLIHNCYKNITYYEDWDKGSYLSFIINNPPTDEAEKIIRLIEFAEMGMLKIVIIDERIAEKIAGKLYNLSKENKIEYYDYLRLRNIYIISHFVNDNNIIPISNNINNKYMYGIRFDRDNENRKININIYDIVKANQNYLTKKNDINGIHAVIIHKSLLTNDLYKGKFNIKDNNYEDWIEEVKKEIPIVVIDSGRGEVDIPKSAKFIPFSFLEEIVIDRLNKYILSRYLLRLTKKMEL